MLAAGIDFLVSHYPYAHEHVYLTVSTTNEPALKLYARTGFEVVERTDGELRMRRRVRRPTPEAESPSPAG